MTQIAPYQRTKRCRPILMMFGTLCLMLALSMFAGDRLKGKAEQDWKARALREAENITNEGMTWLQLMQTDLRNLAVVFHASDQVSQTEFLDALSIIEDRDFITPVTSWGLAVSNYPQTTGMEISFKIELSTEPRGLFSVGYDLGAIPSIRKTAIEAWANEGRIVSGQTFTNGNGARQLLFAIAVPYRGREAILFSSIDLDDFMEDFKELYTPTGMALRRAELLQTNLATGYGTPITHVETHMKDGIFAFDFLTQSSGTHWRFSWEADQSYGGGVRVEFGDLIQWGGVAFCSLLFVLFMHMSRENIRINRLVQDRTADLNKALAMSEKTNEKLQRISQSDSLTGLPNRRSMDEFLEREWAICQRQKQPFAIIIMDIDYFKAYNDALGHLAGDDCLRKVAEILKTAIHRPGDLLARYGGEEFLCILPDTDKIGTETLCLRLNEAIRTACVPHPSSPISNFLTISIGAACCTAGHHIPVDMIIELADQQLYAAKNSGRNRCCLKVIG